MLRVPMEGKMKGAEWRGPYVILDRPTTMCFNLPTKSVKRRTFHRNSLKSFVRSVNTLKVLMIKDSDGEGMIPSPGEKSEQAGKTRAIHLFWICSI